MPFADRNVIAHSHGGQVALFCAARGVPIRTLTTVGTPVRHDVPAAAARKRVLFWQHIYDKHCDWVQKLGQLADGKVSTERRFRLSGVQNHGLAGISHSKVLRDERYLHYWRVNGWLANVRTAGALEVL